MTEVIHTIMLALFIVTYVLLSWITHLCKPSVSTYVSPGECSATRPGHVPASVLVNGYNGNINSYVCPSLIITIFYFSSYPCCVDSNLLTYHHTLAPND